jgi:[ribosomal protein S5]-alanine N-acetyltransferase
MQSARLTLKTICADDSALFIALYTNADVMKYVCAPLSEADAQILFEQRATPWHYDSDNWLGFTIITTADNDKIGTIGLRITDRETHTAEVGFMLRPDAQGHGYIPEALSLLQQYAITTLQLTRLVAVCAAENTGSAKVLQKSGFHYRRQLAANTEINGVWVDDLYFEWFCDAVAQQ